MEKPEWVNVIFNKIDSLDNKINSISEITTANGQGIETLSARFDDVERDIAGLKSDNIAIRNGISDLKQKTELIPKILEILESHEKKILSLKTEFD